MLVQGVYRHQGPRPVFSFRSYILVHDFLRDVTGQNNAEVGLQPSYLSSQHYAPGKGWRTIGISLLPAKPTPLAHTALLNPFIIGFVFFFLRFYLFGRKHKQGEKEKQTPNWAGSPLWGSIPGPRDHDLSWTTQVPPVITVLFPSYWPDFGQLDSRTPES